MNCRLWSLLALLLVLLGLIACGPTATPAPTAIQATTAPGEGVPEPAARAATTPAPLEAEAVVAAREQAAFTYADPESQGLSAEALKQLADVVRGYVADDIIVGAELVVIKNRRIVLHEAIGWKDRDDEMPMEPNTLFNIRSMTKPVIGTAIQMLVDEGTLALDDRASEYLPAFDNYKSGEITIEHLLTHRSGLPLSLLTSLAGYSSIQEIARQAGLHGPDFEPGTDFQYSDTAADALGAILAKASGVSIDEFLEKRIIGPLAMNDTITLVDKDDPRTRRICSAYIGSKGDWSRYWSPGDEPIYPFAMGSQSLYSTPIDYARFLALWMDGGQSGERRLLSPEAIERALTPVSEAKMPTGFPGLRVDYGQMWMVYVSAEAPDGAEPLAFGHNGSDGTFAWAWPELDLMVLYFTQSRGQATGIRLETEINRLLINPGAEEAVTDVPEEYELYLGTYTALSGPLMYQEFTVLVQNGHLAVSLPGQLVVELEAPDEKGKWRFTIDDTVAVSFERDGAGTVTTMKIHQARETFELPRGTAPPEPELDLEAVQKCLGFYRDEEAGHNVEVLIHNDRLAIKVPDTLVILELYSPDQEGKWHVRLNPAVAISFNESEDGRVESLTAHTPEGEFVRPRVEAQDSE